MDEHAPHSNTAERSSKYSVPDASWTAPAGLTGLLVTYRCRQKKLRSAANCGPRLIKIEFELFDVGQRCVKTNYVRAKVLTIITFGYIRAALLERVVAPVAIVKAGEFHVRHSLRKHVLGRPGRRRKCRRGRNQSVIAEREAGETLVHNSDRHIGLSAIPIASVSVPDGILPCNDQIIGKDEGIHCAVAFRVPDDHHVSAGIRESSDVINGDGVQWIFDPVISDLKHRAIANILLAYVMEHHVVDAPPSA